MKKSNLVKFIRKAAETCSEYIYPSNIYCMCCGDVIEPDDLYSLCSTCLAELNWANEKLCACCGKPLESWYPAELCAECSSKVRSFDYGITCFLYQEREREMIHQFKYHGKSYMSRKFSEILCDKINALGINCDIVIPVPMFEKKERKRGYNQAALIAQFTADKLCIPYRRDLLLRVKDTLPMNKLGAKDRRKNLEGAFEVVRGAEEVLYKKRVMLTDDIYTTGTTAEHCSELLKKAGASSVTVVSIAAGRNQRVLPIINKNT